MRKNGQQSLVFEEGKTGTHWYRGADEPSGIDRVETPFTTPPSDSFADKLQARVVQLRHSRRKTLLTLTFQNRFFT